MKRTLLFAILLYGFSAIITQIVLIRELIVAFYGNELAVGIILANWLFLVGLGSWVFGRLADRLNIGTPGFVITQILVSIILPAQIFFTRIFKNISTIPGQMPGLNTILMLSFIILAPLCIIFGAQFSIACRIFAREIMSKIPQKAGATRIDQAAAQIGTVYIYESIGAILGGGLFSYLVVQYLHSFQIAFFVGSLNLISGLLIETVNIRAKKVAKHYILISILSLLLLTNFFTLNTKKISHIRNLSLKLQWRGYNLSTSKDSIYGNLTVTQRDSQFSFFENGLLMFSTQDVMTNEEIVHFPLLQHPHPKTVLLIGGGASGVLTEILKHPVERLVYVELDPLVIELAEYYISGTDKKALQAPQVIIKHIDGRLFVKQTNDQFDLIIINLPDPSTALLNRFYTLEFFEEIKRILAPGGILSLGITGSEAYLGKELSALNTSIFKTLQQTFASCIVIPGEHYFYLASNAPNVLTYDPQILTHRLKARQINNQWVNQYNLLLRLSPFKIQQALENLKAKDARINTDYHPICYYYDMLLWTSLFSTKLKNAFNWISQFSLHWLTGAVFILMVVVLLMMKMNPRHRRLSIPVALAITGFAGIVLEVVLIFAFQALYGYAYYKIGLIVTCFMAGLVLGSVWMNKSLAKITYGYRLFAIIIFALIVYSLLTPLLLTWLGAGVSGIYLFISVQIIFPILVMIVGLLVGLEFPLANKLYLAEDIKIARTAGTLYAADLLGACIGAFLSSAILVPVLGIFNTCLILSGLNVVSLFLVMVSRSLEARIM